MSHPEYYNRQYAAHPSQLHPQGYHMPVAQVQHPAMQHLYPQAPVMEKQPVYFNSVQMPQAAPQPTREEILGNLSKAELLKMLMKQMKNEGDLEK